MLEARDTRNWSLLSIFQEERTQQNEVSSSSHENSTSMVAAGGSSSSKNPNSFTLVSELAELSSPNTRVDMNMHRNWENISNSNSTTSTTSPSHSSATTSVSTSTSTSSSDCLLSPPPRSSINIQVDKLLAPVDANPRKNSPSKIEFYCVIGLFNFIYCIYDEKFQNYSRFILLESL